MGSLEWDDLSHGLAVATLVAYIATYTPTIMQAQPLSDSDLALYIRYILALSLLFWVCIYLIKLSFLLLYRKLFGVSQRFMRVWWAVAIFTLITFLACILASFWVCSSPGLLFVAGMHLLSRSTYEGSLTRVRSLLVRFCGCYGCRVRKGVVCPQHIIGSFQ